MKLCVNPNLEMDLHSFTLNSILLYLLR